MPWHDLSAHQFFMPEVKMKQQTPVGKGWRHRSKRQSRQNRFADQTCVKWHHLRAVVRPPTRLWPGFAVGLTNDEGNVPDKLLPLCLKLGISPEMLSIEIIYVLRFVRLPRVLGFTHWCCYCAIDMDIMPQRKKSLPSHTSMNRLYSSFCPWRWSREGVIQMMSWSIVALQERPIWSNRASTATYV